MKLYLATTAWSQITEGHVALAQRDLLLGNVGYLVSFFYYGKRELDKVCANLPDPAPRFFADSGGFSAFTKGAEIDIDAYAAWIKLNEHWFDVYANLDVIGDAAATAINQTKLEEKGLRPMPVFHVGDDFGLLSSLADRYDYIALGGMVPHSARTKALGRWMKHCFSIVGERARMHGFGATGMNMRGFPWKSVDSSSWIGLRKFGQLDHFNPLTGNFIKIHLGWTRANKKNSTSSARLWLEYAQDFRDLGFDPMQFVDKERYNSSDAAVLGTIEYARLANYLNQPVEETG